MSDKAGQVILTAGLAGGTAALVSKVLQAKPVEAAPTEEKIDYAISLLESILAKPTATIEITPEAASQIAQALTAGVTLIMPVNPRALLEMLMGLSTKLEGLLWAHQYLFAYSVPAGETRIESTVIPDGWVVVVSGALSMESTFYNPDILYSVIVAGEYIAINGPLIRAVTLPSGIFKPVHEKTDITLALVNGTGTDIIVSPSFVPIYLEKSYFDEVYLPMLEKSYATIQDLLIFGERSVEYAGSLR